MDISAADMLKRLSVPVNPKTQTELEQRWNGIKALKELVQSQAKNDYDIALVNTAGGDHVK
ncbi:hypothetical protein ACFODO_16510 [Acinetobacter sichuanensis]|uniref:Uncharacterized protein n=1 Tax=Acinetobacter sichuanensis TaxID=2136183 RepID=A0A371YMF5_9GAMM|nr:MULTISPECIES: hypothetical protein [Acinetobacter]MDM1247707.1 hypothetical protein [Acinetobacter sp. R933-2]MDM1768078.1 hypothetical protein [Acinetobacter sp. 226-4]MDQ9021284.1 hypothetical protein [Acinetobacter sichuanensis]RFC82534.1 hypothetical protein C9E89_016190 [Acinetobacter sichuanensis]